MPPTNRSKSSPARVVVIVVVTILLVLGGYLALSLVLATWLDEPLLVTGILAGASLAVLIAVSRFRPSCLTYRPPAPKLAPSYPVWVLGGLLLVFLSGQATALLLYQELGSGGYDAVTEQQARVGWVATAVLVLLVAPVGEEALFRGLLYPTLRRSVPTTVAVALTATLFSLLHGNLVQGSGTILLAVLLALVHEHTRSLRACIGVHLGFNLLAVSTPAVLLTALATPGPVLILGMAAIGYLTIWHTRTLRGPSTKNVGLPAAEDRGKASPAQSDHEPVRRADASFCRREQQG